MSKKKIKELCLPAIEIKQGKKKKIYTFAIDGKQLTDIATISRIHRDEKGLIDGYQRPEVLNHVAEIRRYLESENPLLPNALVVAFDERVQFEQLPMSCGDASEYAQVGTLKIPVNGSMAEEEKPGWIVDGQQRTAAIQEANIASFPISVVAFITKNVAEQRAQFILVNETKPLPRPLIDELLPGVDEALPKRLTLRVLPNRLLERLNNDEDSPLKGKIRTQTMPDGVIAANSIIQGLKSSISDGSLYCYRDPETGDGDMEAMLDLLKSFWSAVKTVFIHDWGKPSRKSRLMHGTGIRSLLSLMDEIVGEDVENYRKNNAEFVKSLEFVKPVCKWSNGKWVSGSGESKHEKYWNDIQNLGNDRKLVTQILVKKHREMNK